MDEKVGASYLKKVQEQNKNTIQTAIDEYKALIRDTLHPDNQTAMYKENVKKILQRLLTMANEIDENPQTVGEGIFGLIALSMRSILLVKDENVRLRKDLDDLRKEVSRLKKQSEVPARRRPQ